MAERACVVWGSSGHARVLRDLLADEGGRIVALVDRNPDAVPVVEGAPVLTPEDLSDFLAAWQGQPLSGCVAIGGARGVDRREVLDIFVTARLETPALIHSRAVVARSASIGAGSHVLAQSVVAADARVGRGCIVNHGTVVDHECVLADGVHIAPGATLCGCVTLDTDAFVGAGATVLPRLHIGARAVIGAGAVVTRDLAPGEVVTGTPARPRTG